jgi:para-aminobenzoate synthetase/4-amino-4-deoxychorismate lyase
MGNAFSLLETMRLEDGRIARLDRHLTRMRGSAAQLGFVWDEARVRGAVDDARAAGETGCWRLRLLVDRAGIATTTVTAHDGRETRTWRVALAASPIDSANALLRHKTTDRALYEAMRRDVRGPQGSAPQGIDDVILWNERGEVTESTIANVVAEIDGVRVTPPVTSGLLPGVYRGELLDANEIRERVVTKDDLARASRVWLVNSLRGWIHVEVLDGRR